jgi:hypothetical protein
MPGWFTQWIERDRAFKFTGLSKLHMCVTAHEMCLHNSIILHHDGRNALVSSKSSKSRGWNALRPDLSLRRKSPNVERVNRREEIIFNPAYSTTFVASAPSGNMPPNQKLGRKGHVDCCDCRRVRMCCCCWIDD